MHLKCFTISKDLTKDMNLWLRVEGEVENQQLNKKEIPFINKYFRWLTSPYEDFFI